MIDDTARRFEKAIYKEIRESFRILRAYSRTRPDEEIQKTIRYLHASAWSRLLDLIGAYLGYCGYYGSTDKS